jgi:enoyl-CoA hydratase/carnithine racemase
MPAEDHTASDEPAFLRVEGSIATITLNPAAAFNSIDLSIAKKLDQLGAEVEANDSVRV